MKKWIIKSLESISYMLVLIALFLDIFTNISMGGMAKIVFYGIPMLLLFGIMLYEIKIEKNVEEKETIKKKRLWTIFCIYLLALITLLFMQSAFRYTGTWQDKLPLFSKENLQNNVNLIPFRTIATYIERLQEHSINLSIVLTNLLGNLVAFAPFGFFATFLMKDKIRNIGIFVLWMIGIVLIVEMLQFFLKLGSADIDDLILNVLGATIVYGVMQIKSIKKGIGRILN